jgi:hypothetical protein
MCVPPNTLSSRRSSQESAAMDIDVSSVDFKKQEASAHSDLKLEITRYDSRRIDTYSVHKVIVTTGPRKCMALESQLQSLMMQDGKATSININLSERAAILVPIVLEFIYHSPNFEITTKTAVGLRHLAEYFRIAQLQEATWQFIKKDIQQLENLELYLGEANYFDDKQTATWVAFECANKIQQIPVSSSIWQDLTPEDFKQSIKVSRACRTGIPLQTSELVAMYCSQHVKELTERIFKELTCCKNLPVISKNAALKLMEVEFRVRQLNGSVGTNTHPEPLSTLQKRCVQALANHQM